MIPQISYGTILDLGVLVFAVMAYWMSEAGGRTVVAAGMLLLYVPTLILSLPVPEVIVIIGKMVFGCGCFIYARWLQLR
jgi:hypothetical protein